MSHEVSWQVELAVKPGQLENFRSLTGEMVEFARSEPGTLSYQRFVSDDCTLVHGYERYVDSAAALAHLHSFAKSFSGRFLAMVERRRITVFGRPDQELRTVLDRYGAVYLKPFGDFSYWG